MLLYIILSQVVGEEGNKHVFQCLFQVWFINEVSYAALLFSLKSKNIWHWQDFTDVSNPEA